MVEPVHPTDGVFGTATPREKMPFGEYIDKMDKERAKYYLTTQYGMEEQADGEEDDGPVLDPLLPSPTHKLKGDFPAHPRILGDLVLQQCNLWLGNSKEGTTSGLHHDFHDNLYLLLSGEKRFVLFPPSAYTELHLRGSVKKLHGNGLIVYEDTDVSRADGLTDLDAAHWRLAARAHSLHNPSAKRTKGHKSAKEAYEAAQREYRELASNLDAPTESESEAESEAEPIFGDAGDDGEDDEFPAESGVEGGLGDHFGEDLLESLDRPEPDSFSLIKPHVLHEHFGLQCAAGAHIGESPKPGKSCPVPLVVELRAGQMLYLPASWFHEVTSTATDRPHMAFNYWMHPPDGYMSPYTDAEVWEAHRRAVLAALDVSV